MITNESRFGYPPPCICLAIVLFPRTQSGNHETEC